LLLLRLLLEELLRVTQVAELGSQPLGSRLAHMLHIGNTHHNDSNKQCRKHAPPPPPSPSPTLPSPQPSRTPQGKKTPNSEIRTRKGSKQFVDFHTKHQFGSQHDSSRREHNGKQLNRKKKKEKEGNPAIYL